MRVYRWLKLSESKATVTVSSTAHANKRCRSTFIRCPLLSESSLGQESEHAGDPFTPEYICVRQFDLAAEVEAVSSPDLRMLSMFHCCRDGCWGRMPCKHGVLCSPPAYYLSKLSIWVCTWQLHLGQSKCWFQHQETIYIKLSITSRVAWS